MFKSVRSITSTALLHAQLISTSAIVRNSIISPKMVTQESAYFSDNPLNRLSYLRSSSAFLTSALVSPKSRFVVLNGLNPLVGPPQDRSIRLRTLSFDQVRPYLVGEGQDDSAVFRYVDDKDEKLPGTQTAAILAEKGVARPPLVFLGCDERSAPSESKSLPLSKPTEDSTLESHSPYGIPYFAIDATNLKELRDSVVGVAGAMFIDMRVGMASIPREDAAIGGEARALIDWNARNPYCAACGKVTRSLWGGWKRGCLNSTATPCSSKKGVQNFNYPRTDPVVIMAVLSPDKQQLLLGRQKIWPTHFYSCLAGFIEPGETIEEAVRREVYEEAGIEIGEVYYHSSSPWPFPSSLMIGAICVAKENQTIRCDLDNELQDARYFSREAVLEVLTTGVHTIIRTEVPRSPGRPASPEHGADFFRMPPKTAIAHTLIQAWANGTAFIGSGGNKL